MTRLETTLTFGLPGLGPTPEELDESSADFINPGVFAKALSDLVASGLRARGYRIGGQIVEDWGRWVEIEHDGGYFLAVGVANVSGDGPVAEHRAFVEPSKPKIRKWFKLVEVGPEVLRLKVALREVLLSVPGTVNLREGD